jgi:hypothetical protein
MTRRNHDSVTEVSCVAVVDKFLPGTAQSILAAVGPHLSSCAFAAIDDAASGRPDGMEQWARVASILLARRPPGPLGLPDAQLDAWLEASWAAVAPQSDPVTCPYPATSTTTDPDTVPSSIDGEATTRLRAAVIPPLASPALGMASRPETAREKFDRRVAKDPLGQTHLGSGRILGMGSASHAYDSREQRKRT